MITNRPDILYQNQPGSLKSKKAKQIKIDPESLAGKVLPAGEPFSRLWLNQGIWRPVRI